MKRRHSLVIAPLVAALVLAACATDPVTSPSSSVAEPMSESASPTASEAPMTDMASPTASPMGESPSPTDAAVPDDPLLTVVLTDVRSGETFTLFDLASEGEPVLLQPMAIWCSSCRSQQHEVRRAHETGDFTSVSLDVDLSEVPEDLARYATDQGWDWRFAMADAELYRLLQERFGVAATNPPSTPLIVIEPGGTVRALEFGTGVRSAEELLAELGAG